MITGELYSLTVLTGKEYQFELTKGFLGLGSTVLYYQGNQPIVLKQFHPKEGT